MDAQLQQGLTSTTSRNIIAQLLGWSRAERDRVLRDSDLDIRTFRDGSLLAPMYAKHEVAQLLDGLAVSVRSSVGKAFDDLTVSVAELTRAVLAEADMQRVLLDSVNAVASLNRLRSLSAAELGDQRVALSALGPSRSMALAPMDAGDDTSRQLQQANEQIRKMRERLNAMQDQYERVMQEKSQLQSDKFALGDQVAHGSQRLADAQASASAAQALLANAGQRTAEQLRGDMAQLAQAHAATVQQLQAQVGQARAESAQLQRDMQAKLSQSSQFVAMKQLVAAKSQKVAQLRNALRRYDPVAAGGDDDDIEAEEDD
jgi:uncharacterized phage infection (PIP) family protein YhgE